MYSFITVTYQNYGRSSNKWLHHRYWKHYFSETKKVNEHSCRAVGYFAALPKLGLYLLIEANLCAAYIVLVVLVGVKSLFLDHAKLQTSLPISEWHSIVTFGL